MDPRLIRLNIDLAGVLLSVDTAIPCGLIVNELVRILTEQLDGTLTLEQQAGTTITLTFAEPLD